MTELTRVEINELPSILKVKEVAQVLRIPLSRAYGLIERGEIQCVRIGRSIRVPRVFLERMIETQQRTA